MTEIKMKAENAYHFSRILKDFYWEFFYKTIMPTIKRFQGRHIDLENRYDIEYDVRRHLHFDSISLRVFLNFSNDNTIDKVHRIPRRSFDLDEFYKDLHYNGVVNLSTSSIDYENDNHIIFCASFAVGNRTAMQITHRDEIQKLTEARISLFGDIYEKLWYVIPRNYIEADEYDYNDNFIKEMLAYKLLKI